MQSYSSNVIFFENIHNCSKLLTTTCSFLHSWLSSLNLYNQVWQSRPFCQFKFVIAQGDIENVLFQYILEVILVKFKYCSPEVVVWRLIFSFNILAHWNMVFLMVYTNVSSTPPTHNTNLKVRKFIKICGCWKRLLNIIANL